MNVVIAYLNRQIHAVKTKLNVVFNRKMHAVKTKVGILLAGCNNINSIDALLHRIAMNKALRNCEGNFFCLMNFDLDYI